MSYLGEVRQHWRPLAGALLGLGFGLNLNGYTAGLFGPPLIAEFGWTKAQFALVSVVPFGMMLIMPFVGRLTDSFGVRRVASVGVLGIPLCLLAMSGMSGRLVEFLGLTFVKMCFGTLVSTTIYTRLVAERFTIARGLALAICMSGPPVIGAVAAPVLADIIHDHGWRTGYATLAALTLVGGAGALLLVPKHEHHSSRPRRQQGSFLADFRMVAGQRIFWLICAGMFLCNLPQALGSSQLKLMALDSGATRDTAVLMLSSYAIGVVVGRFACGLALDRFAPQRVAFVSLSMPAFGFLGLYSSFDAAWFMVGAMMLVGVAQGAEGDVAAFLVTRHFDLENYSFVLGMVSSALSGASAFGALMLTIMLHGTDDYADFILFAAVVSVLGASAFLFIGTSRESKVLAEEY